jgi:hypothetical protein
MSVGISYKGGNTLLFRPHLWTMAPWRRRCTAAKTDSIILVAAEIQECVVLGLKSEMYGNKF